MVEDETQTVSQPGIWKVVVQTEKVGVQPEITTKKKRNIVYTKFTS